jgi:hypothetical protein
MNAIERPLCARSEQLSIVVFIVIVLTFGNAFRVDYSLFSEKLDTDNFDGG